MDLLKRVATKAIQNVGNTISGAASSAYGYLTKYAPEMFQQGLQSNPYTRPFSNQGQEEIANVGRFLQKMPDTTYTPPPTSDFIKKTPLAPLFDNPLTEARDNFTKFATSIPGEMIRETGKAFENVATPQGRSDIFEGIKKYPQQTSDLFTGTQEGGRIQTLNDLLNNPATVTAFGLTNVPSPKNVIKKGVGELAEQGLKKGVKKGTQELFEQGAKKGLKNEVNLVADELGRIAPAVETGVKKTINPVSTELLNTQNNMKNIIESTGKSMQAGKGALKKISEYLFGNSNIRGSRGVIAKEGDAGKIITDTIDSAESLKSDLAGKAKASLRTAIKDLNDDELTTFADVVEGTAKPISEAQSNAVNIWKGIREDIHNLATETGMKIGKLENYFPHFNIKNGRASLDEGSFIDRGANVDYGNLTKSRLAENAEYSKNPNVLFDYIDHAYDNIVKRSYFGHGDENLYKLADKTTDSSQVKSMLDSILHKGPRGGLEEKISSKITSAQTSKLGFVSPLTNLTQQLSTIARTDVPTAIKTYSKMIQNPEQTVLNAIKANEISPELGNKVLKNMQGLEDASFGRKWLEFIKFNLAEKGNRIFSVNAGMEYAGKLAKQAGEGSEAAVRELGRLGIKDIANMTDDDIVRAGRKISQETQFSTKAGELPQGWETNAGRVITQFKGFGYKQTGFIKNQVVRIAEEAKAGNFKPLVSALTAYGVGSPLIGEVINNVRSFVTNKKRDDEGLQRYINDVAAGSSLGLLDNAGALFGQYGEGGVISTLGGPTAGDAYKGIKALTDTSAGISNYDPDKSVDENLDPNNTTKRALLKAIPGVGSTLSNTLVPNSFVDNNIGGVNEGLSEKDAETYRLLEQTDPTAAENFKTENNYAKQEKKDMEGKGFGALFGAKTQTAWETKPTTKKEKSEYDKKVDSALEAGAVNIPESAIITRFFDDKTYDKATRKEKNTMLDQLLKSDSNEYYTPEQKSLILKASKVSEDDFNYYKSSSADPTDRLESLLAYASQEHPNRDEFMQDLVMGRREVGGKSLFSIEMFNTLYDQGLISKDEKAMLSAVKYDSIYNKFYMDRDYKGGGTTSAQIKAAIKAANALHKNTISKPKGTVKVEEPLAPPKISFKKAPKSTSTKTKTSRWFNQY